MHIPENASSLLLDVINSLRELPDLGVDRDSPDYDRGEDLYTADHFKYVDRITPLVLLPHRWCNVDPFRFGCQLYRTAQLCFFVFKERDGRHPSYPQESDIEWIQAWGRNVTEPRVGKRFSVPDQLWCTINGAACAFPDPLNRREIDEIITELSILRKMIDARPLESKNKRGWSTSDSRPQVTQPTVPENAVAILNDVVNSAKLAQSVRANDTDSDWLCDEYVNLSEAMELLPFLWCRIDPLVYDVWLRRQPPKYELVFALRESAPQLFAPDMEPWFGYWPEDTAVPKSAICHAVPYELAELLSYYLGPEPCRRQIDIDDKFVDFAILTLEHLRKVVVIRESVINALPAGRDTAGQQGSRNQALPEDGELRGREYLGSSSLLTIPDNSVSLIDDVISLIRAAITYGDEDEANASETSSEECPYQPHFDLAHALDIFPHRWALFDPLIWDCWLHEDPTGYGLIFTLRSNAPRPIEARVAVPVFDLWPNGVPLPHSTVRHVLPSELGRLLALSREESGIQWMNEGALYVAEGWASDLRRKLIARTQLRTKPDLPSVSEETAATTEYKVPRLTDSGRTLVCAKGTFTFTNRQRSLIRIFWENYLQGNAYLREQDVLEDESVNMSRSSFASIFKSRRDHIKAVFERHNTEKDLWRLNLG